MFKKHEFTCPDVIYLRKRTRNNALLQGGVVLIALTAVSVNEWRTARKNTAPDLSVVENDED
jgi:hypothetical protein